jgi:2-polyprenyl-6-hydroxyphenyl methylase/3-demethylubiquinone-9 3-methyltransferase
MTKSTANAQEIEQFTHLAMHWWDEQGPMQPLHRINLVRMPLLRRWIETHARPVKGAKILDVGCGGGLVCEPLARLGAQVTGIDAGQENIDVARAHAEQSGLDIAYICTTAENFISSSSPRKRGSSRADKLDSRFRGNDEGLFDVVLALEIIEHVDEPELFVQSLLKLVKPGGLIIFSTLNRNPKSFALGIVAAEYILRWLPRGTHDWKKFKKPSEIAAMLGDKAKVTDITGMVYDSLRATFSENPKDVDVNYFLAALRQN